VANTLNTFRNGAVGFIDWLDACVATLELPLHMLAACTTFASGAGCSSLCCPQ